MTGIYHPTFAERQKRYAQGEYLVECLSAFTGGWYFVSRLHGLTLAVELAAVIREVKCEPSRVRPVPPTTPRGYT